MSGGSDKGKKTERHSTRKGAGSILKLTYTSPGTNEGTRIALGGTAITISSDEEYEDVASPTMTVDLPSTPIGVPFDSATGQGKRFIFADEEEEEDLYVRDVLGGSAVVAPTTVVEPTTPAVIPPGVVRTTIAALQAVAAGGSAVVAPTTAVEPTTTVVEPTTPAVDPTTSAVIPPGVVRTTIAALQAVAAGGSAVVAPTTAVEPTTTVVEPTTTVVATQTDPMEFPFVFPVRKGEKWWL